MQNAIVPCFRCQRARLSHGTTKHASTQNVNKLITNNTARVTYKCTQTDTHTHIHCMSRYLRALVEQHSNDMTDWRFANRHIYHIPCNVQRLYTVSCNSAIAVCKWQLCSMRKHGFVELVLTNKKTQEAAHYLITCSVYIWPANFSIKH